jgi:uncharacterized protein (TIGR02996 family)
MVDGRRSSLEVPRSAAHNRFLMTYDDAFLQAIIDESDDDTPRLVYADWLEENGQSARAAFIRAQIESASLPAGNPRGEECRMRAAVLRGEHERVWLGPLCAWLERWGFERGFVERVTVNAQTFLKHAGTIFRLAPIRHAEICRAERFGRELAACPHLARLTSLRIHKLFVDDTVLLIASPHLNKLTELDLRENGFGDEGVEALAYSTLMAQLVRLDLSCNSIRDAGVQTLAESPQTGRLEWLDLSRNKIEEAGAMALAGSEALNGLRVLRLWGFWIGEIGRERLRDRFGDRVKFV